jgi:Homeodomain-like domain
MLPNLPCLCQGGRVDITRPPPDEALTCLSALAASAGELYRRVSQFSESVAHPTHQRAGASYAAIMPLEKRLAMMEEISAAIRVLARDGNRFRRMEARALYAEGLTMAQLAAVFGVSRQRVSVLLRDPRDDGPDDQPYPVPPDGPQFDGVGP